MERPQLQRVLRHWHAAQLHQRWQLWALHSTQQLRVAQGLGQPRLHQALKPRSPWRLRGPACMQQVVVRACICVPAHMRRKHVVAHQCPPHPLAPKPPLLDMLHPGAVPGCGGKPGLPYILDGAAPGARGRSRGIALHSTTGPANYVVLSQQVAQVVRFARSRVRGRQLQISPLCQYSQPQDSQPDGRLTTGTGHEHRAVRS